VLSAPAAFVESLTSLSSPSLLSLYSSLLDIVQQALLGSLSWKSKEARPNRRGFCFRTGFACRDALAGLLSAAGHGVTDAVTIAINVPSGLGRTRGASPVRERERQHSAPAADPTHHQLNRAKQGQFILDHIESGRPEVLRHRSRTAEMAHRRGKRGKRRPLSTQPAQLAGAPATSTFTLGRRGTEY